MQKAKNNQAKNYFSYKNDDVDLVEIGQFLRDAFKFRVEREWFIVFNEITRDYLGYTPNIVVEMGKKIRNPDLMIIKDNKIKLIIEIDGGIHDKKMFDTEQRNAEYEFAGLPLLVINKLEIETTIFDLVYKKVNERIGN